MAEQQASSAIVVDFEKLMESMKANLQPEIAMTFKVDGNDPTIAFTFPDSARSFDFAERIRAIGDLAYLLLGQAYKNRSYDCDEDDGHPRWNTGYA